MNRKGFTLVELLAVIVIISMIMMVVYPSISKMQKKTGLELYKSYEKMMVEYATVSSYKENEIIQLDELIQEENSLQEIKNFCSGYVLHNDNDYKAYIDCGTDYKTEGFNNN